ncbi:NAD(P)H-dependent flavin oxidoreductase [Patulibacter minatonensis]|uniref:NAD(P)H-dependent flavin oxidoreductase n=1 Tax=Patulibacter minatonensis TaxID=298163 RepID=UPI0006870D5F|nr:nitronate monooxygenase family protein [Patulibacter minatonensis]
MSLSTRFTELVGIEHPVVQEGLGPYRLVHLAAAVSNAGGLGTVSMPGMTDLDGARVLRGYIEEACTMTDKPFAVNVPVGADSSGKVLPFSAAYVQAVVDARADPEIAKRLKVITTSAGAPSVVRPIIEGSGLVHLHKVGGTRQALRAQSDGVDAIIASGYEAGGHTHSRPVHTIVLGPNVTEAVDIPVVLAGGIRDGRTVAAAFALGADAVAMGTRFVASHDNPDWNEAYAKAVVEAGEGDDVVFKAVYGPSRALRTPGLAELAELEETGAFADVDAVTQWKDQRLISAQRDGDIDGGILPMGQVASGIKDLIHVAEYVPGVMADARRVLAGLQ